MTTDNQDNQPTMKDLNDAGVYVVAGRFVCWNCKVAAGRFVCWNCKVAFDRDHSCATVTFGVGESA